MIRPPRERGGVSPIDWHSFSSWISGSFPRKCHLISLSRRQRRSVSHTLMCIVSKRRFCEPCLLYHATSHATCQHTRRRSLSNISVIVAANMQKGEKAAGAAGHHPRGSWMFVVHLPLSMGTTIVADFFLSVPASRGTFFGRILELILSKSRSWIEY